MSDMDSPAPRPRKQRQGFWLTLGEIVGVLALVIAGLNFWDSHKQHAEDARRAQAQTQAATAFVAVGEADGEGRTVVIHPLKSAQAIQSERYSFPRDIADGPKEITADRPRIQLDWVASGLKRALDEVHAKGSGSARVPVLIETVYAEDGDTLNDVSMYQLGFSWKRGFLGGWQVRLEGIALAKRAVEAGGADALERRWRTSKAALSPAAPTSPAG